jgi:hypothetical protein
MRTSNYTLKVTPNYSKRTFTIREYCKGKLFSKYRTIQFNEEEFENEEMNTENDWRYFLRTTNDYSLLK